MATESQVFVFVRVTVNVPSPTHMSFTCTNNPYRDKYQYSCQCECGLTAGYAGPGSRLEAIQQTAFMHNLPHVYITSWPAQWQWM